MRLLGVSLLPEEIFERQTAGIFSSRKENHPLIPRFPKHAGGLTLTTDCICCPALFYFIFFLILNCSCNVMIRLLLSGNTNRVSSINCNLLHNKFWGGGGREREEKGSFQKHEVELELLPLRLCLLFNESMLYVSKTRPPKFFIFSLPGVRVKT